MEKIVEINNVTKVYGDGNNSCVALKKVNINIENGDFVSIMGPSGAGKSTLINILSTIDRATEGDVFINNVDVTNMSDDEICNFRRKEVGFIFQDCNLIDTISIRENIQLCLELAGISFEECKKRISNLAPKLNIEDLLDKYPAECSGGQRQRAAACRALATHPSILVADEPTGALDSKNSKELMTILRNINKEDKVTIVMVTHEPLIASYSNKVLFIRDGIIDEVIAKNNYSQKEFYHVINEESSKEVNALFSAV